MVITFPLLFVIVGQVEIIVFVHCLPLIGHGWSLVLAGGLSRQILVNRLSVGLALAHVVVVQFWPIFKVSRCFKERVFFLDLLCVQVVRFF